MRASKKNVSLCRFKSNEGRFTTKSISNTAFNQQRPNHNRRCPTCWELRHPLYVFRWTQHRYLHVGIFEESASMTSLSIHPRAKQEYVSFNETLHPNPYQCTITILPHQTSNEVEHVNNIEYLRWIDKAAQLHCDSCGWEREALLDVHVMWFVARHEIDYCSESTPTDQLLLTTWVDDVRRVKSWRTSYIHALGDTPRVVCVCKTLWVLVDLETRKPTAVPIEMAEALEPLKPARIST